MPDIRDTHRDDDKLAERLERDEPGAPRGYLLDRDDDRTPCSIGRDEPEPRETP